MDHKELTQFLGDCYNIGSAALGLALGNELGLFTLMSDLDRPFTSQELADAGSFEERYIREWLGAMACSRIINYDVETEHFFVCRENLDVLVKSPKSSVFGVLALSGARHELLKTAFMNDTPNGILLSETKQFGAWIDSHRDSHFVHVLDDELLKISGLRKKLEWGICVADIGCGVGRMAILMAQRFPKSTFWALDIDDEALAIGRQRAKEANLKNVLFEEADAHCFSQSMYSKFDYIVTYDCIHDLPHPGKAVEEIYKSLKDGGTYSMIEPHAESKLGDNIKASNGTSLYMTSLYWCLPHSLSVPGGEGHGRTLGKDRLLGSLKTAGFIAVKITKSGSDPGMDYFLCQK